MKDYDILIERGIDLELCIQRMNRRIDTKKNQHCPKFNGVGNDITQYKSGNYRITTFQAHPMVRGELFEVCTYQEK